MDANASGAGVDQQRAQVEAFMGQLRDLDQQIQQVMGQMPALGEITQQMRGLIKQAVQQAVSTMPKQTGSAAALPMAGM